MKRFITILLLISFFSGFTPVVKMMCLGDEVCLADVGEEDEQGENTMKAEKKELKETILPFVLLPASTQAFTLYGCNSHPLGNDPINEILTPPPNRA